MLDRVLVKDRLESKLRRTCRVRVCVYQLDRVLDKDRLESKLRQVGRERGEVCGWIGSWSKIGLRANSDKAQVEQTTDEVGSGPGQRSA